MRPPTDLRHVFIRSVQSIDRPLRCSQFDRQNPILLPLFISKCGGILISGEVRLRISVCLTLGRFSRLFFIIGTRYYRQCHLQLVSDYDLFPASLYRIPSLFGVGRSAVIFEFKRRDLHPHQLDSSSLQLLHVS